MLRNHTERWSQCVGRSDLQPSRVLQVAPPGVLWIVSVLGIGCMPHSASAAAQQDSPPIAHHEVPDDLPRPASTETGGRTRVSLGSYTSVQVNVDAAGNNILGDAANEPSIAVDLTDSQNLVIGWRQFDTITSNFRQAGWAYSHDSGASWTFPARIEAGLFRSDPVIACDAKGTFYYQSLNGDFDLDVFRSFDKGVTWSTKTADWGGDKNWLTLDATGGIGDDHLYTIWQRFFNCCDEDTFSRSTDSGASFQVPLEIPEAPTFGILDVGPDGTVWSAGIQANDSVGQNFDQYVVAHSANANDATQTPTFTTVFVDMGGSMRFGTGPNPAGLLGQAYVRADPTQPLRAFALASANPPGSDPLDVFLIKTEDGGDTWSAPRRVNDDPDGTDAWQWLGAMSVAPDGRIDVIWNDTRNTGASNLSETFYTFSYDAGETWLGQGPFTPVFDSYVGWPQQDKMGDYYDLRSALTGADVAYSATFNGEQDVYYVRLFPDCNQNGVSDYDDISSGASQDVDADRLPDDCEAFSLAADPLEPVRGSNLELSFDNGQPSTPCLLFVTEVGGVKFTQRVLTAIFDANGRAVRNVTVPNDPALEDLAFQIVNIGFFLDGRLTASNPVDLVVR